MLFCIPPLRQPLVIFCNTGKLSTRQDTALQLLVAIATFDARNVPWSDHSEQPKLLNQPTLLVLEMLTNVMVYSCVV